MKKTITFFLALVIFSSSIISASAVYYEDTFPSDKTGVTGGLFIECQTNIGDAVILIPYDYKYNTFTFGTNGNVFNCSYAGVNCALYINGHKYTCRWTSFSYPQYRIDGNQYTYSDLVITSVTDTNVVFLTDTEQSNDNYYLSVFEKILLCVLLCILFLQFLMWFLLHRR